MRAGLLDREILIEYKAVTIDPDYGTDIVTWTPLSYLDGSPQVAERYAASVTDILQSKAENVLNGLTVGRNLTRIRMRWREDIDSSMRVTVFGESTNPVYEIVGAPADMDGRKSMIEFICERYTV